MTYKTLFQPYTSFFDIFPRGCGIFMSAYGLLRLPTKILCCAFLLLVLHLFSLEVLGGEYGEHSHQASIETQDAVEKALRLITAVQAAYLKGSQSLSDIDPVSVADLSLIREDDPLLNAHGVRLWTMLYKTRKTENDVPVMLLPDIAQADHQDKAYRGYFFCLPSKKQLAILKERIRSVHCCNSKYDSIVLAFATPAQYGITGIYSYAYDLNGSFFRKDMGRQLSGIMDFMDENPFGLATGWENVYSIALNEMASEIMPLPEDLQTRKLAVESFIASKVLRYYCKAQVLYLFHTMDVHADSLDKLFQPSGRDGPSKCANLIPEAFARGVDPKTPYFGYIFLEPQEREPIHPNYTPLLYQLIAIPEQYGITGTYCYWVKTGTIYAMDMKKNVATLDDVMKMPAPDAEDSEWRIISTNWDPSQPLPSAMIKTDTGGSKLLDSTESSPELGEKENQMKQSDIAAGGDAGKK